MKKNLFFVAAAALALTACSSDSEVTQTATQKAAPQAVAFDTYVPEATTTRAGDAGIQTTSTLQGTGKGFGVFAVQSDNSTYLASLTTNFMWNEHVTYSSSAWSYSPLKYWPNETDNDSQTPEAANAESDNIDRLSFFAYAPYVAERTDQSGMVSGVTAYSAAPTASAHNATAGETTGIVALSSNNDATNDPYVWYVASTIPSESVDLLWGVAPAGGLSYTSVAKGLTNATGVAQISTGTVTVAEGMPLVDLIKPVKDEKIKFLFKHALARLGVTVVAAIDQISPGGDYEDTNGDGNYTTADATHVAVESIVIDASQGTNKLYSEGLLNLKNTTAGQSKWDVKNNAISALTINKTSELSDEIRWDTNPTTTLAITGFNGVDKTERKAMREGGTYNADPAYFMLIPSHGATKLTVTITYYVFTADSKLAGGYAITKNVISKDITIDITNNKAYNLKLILGLTSVKLDAEVADWENAGSTPVDLPQNTD